MGTRSFKSKWKIIWKKKGLLVKDDKTRQHRSHIKITVEAQKFPLPTFRGN